MEYGHSHQDGEPRDNNVPGGRGGEAQVSSDHWGGEAQVPSQRAQDGRASSRAGGADYRQQFLAIFEQSAVGMAHIALDGQFLRVNRHLAELTGYSPEELMARPLEELTGDRDAVTAAFRRLLSGESERENAQTHYLRKDGGRVWIETALTLARDIAGQPAYLIGVIQDIDACKKEQEAHRQTHRQFRALVEGLKMREERLQKAYDVQKGIAELLQRSLLLTPPPDSFPGITIKPFYESAYDDSLVGGDFFDVFAVDVNLVALVVGDVTGKGLEAATYTAEIKYALRAFLREYADPGIALERLNNFVCDRERLDAIHLGTTYVALAVVMANTATGETIAASGGIDPPFIIPIDGGEAFQLRLTGALLGVVEDSRYVTTSVQLAPGDVLGMTTDGLTEARSTDGLFGIDGVMRELQAARHEPLAEMEHRVVASARAHAGGRINDDLCLLLVRRL